MRKAFVIAYILFVCAFNFLPKSVDTGLFLSFVLGSAGCVELHRDQFHTLYGKDSAIQRLRKLYILFLCVSAIYLLLSFLNLPKNWGIRNLLFSRSHIPRHFIIVAELFLPVLLADAIYKLRLFNWLKTPYLILFFLLVFFGVHALCVIGILLVTLALISWKCEKKILLLPAFFLNHHQSAYVMGFLALVLLLCFEKPIARYLYKNTFRKIVILTLLAIICVFLLSGVLAFYIEKDANSLWRLQVWGNEIHSLAQTYFTGVGFGSAYVTEDIVDLVDNANMYFENTEGALEAGVFVVANHSSLLNMFYRMGLIGGGLFFLINIQIIRIVIKFYRKGNRRERALLWRLFAVWMYQTVVIFLNPGLEMMQFAVSYLLCLSCLLADILAIRDRPRPYDQLNPLPDNSSR